MRYFITSLLIVIVIVLFIHSNDAQLTGQKVLGTTNPDITQANIKNNICNPNWSTASIRPPTSFTSPLKARLCKQQHCGDPSKYELDHRIALVDGGAPADPNNLWLQPYPEAHLKDTLEVLIHKKICSYEITLTQGQAMLKGDWLMYYNQYYKHVLGAVESNISDPDDI